MGTKQCPVRYLKILETSLFFLAINHNACRTKSTWYKLLQIGQFLPKLACKPMDENFPTIPRLLDAGISENFVTQLSGHKNLQSLSSYKSASLAPQRQMSDSLPQQIPPPNSSVHEPVFPVNQSSSSFQRSVSNQPCFSVQAMPHHSFFASATIGSIPNCVFNIVHPRDTASSCEENVSERPKLDGSS